MTCFGCSSCTNYSHHNVPVSIQRWWGLCDVTSSSWKTWSATDLRGCVTFRWSDGLHFHMTTLAWSHNKLKGMGSSMVLCCCSPSPSRLNELSAQRCPSAHHCCTELLFVCSCPSCYLGDVWQRSAAVSELLKNTIWKQQLHKVQTCLHFSISFILQPNGERTRWLSACFYVHSHLICCCCLF